MQLILLLQNAVEEIQALAQVKANHQQLHVTQGVALSYTQYVQLHTISALQLDKKKPTGRRFVLEQSGFSDEGSSSRAFPTKPFHCIRLVLQQIFVLK